MYHPALNHIEPPALSSYTDQPETRRLQFGAFWRTGEPDEHHSDPSTTTAEQPTDRMGRADSRKKDMLSYG